MHRGNQERAGAIVAGVMSLGIAAFGIFWAVSASRMGAPPFFAAFGILFVVIALVGAGSAFFKAFGSEEVSPYERTSSDAGSSPFRDPATLDRQAPDRRTPIGDGPLDAGFCPHCGVPLGRDFNFCPQCGRDL